MRAYSLPPWTGRTGSSLTQGNKAMTALINFIDSKAAPVAISLMLACLPLAAVGFFAQSF